MGLSNKIVDVQALRENVPKIVTYVGHERGDIITALANTLANAGLNTLIIDRSRKRDIYESLTDNDEGLPVTRGYLTVARKDSAELRAAADIVFEYNGIANVPVPAAEYLITACSPDAQDIKAVSATLNAEYNTRYIILRNPDGKYKVKDICHDMKLKDSKLVSVTKRDIKELDSWNAFTRNHARNVIKGFTASLNCYMDILGDLTKMPVKQLKKLAKKGGAIL